MSIEKPLEPAAREESTPEREAWDRTVAAALEKRAAFNAALTSATSVEEVKRALEDVAVEDELSGKKVVVNFFEGAMASTNETDGVANLDEILEGVDKAAVSGVSDFHAITNHVWNYAAAGALERILNSK